MSPPHGVLTARTRAFYVRAMRALAEAGVPFLVGGAYALERTTAIERHTKDFDVFVRPGDRDRALAALAAVGCRTELTHPHWLAKARDAAAPEARFIDVIYRSGNGIAEVDNAWFAHAPESEVLGERVRLTPPEETLWSKCYIMERERFDGADVAHLIRAAGDRLDWDRLLARFGPHWRVLLAHLILFGFIYPAERAKVPARVMHSLIDRLRAETRAPAPDAPLCQGTLLSRAQYLVDLERDGLEDARAEPRGSMTPEDIEHWTEAIAIDGPH
jgi:hypothetical protein